MPGTLELHSIRGCSTARSADIIFVHGLGGDPFDTWKHPDLFWPEALGIDVQHAGVWSLGYPAAKTEWSGTAMPLSDRAINVLTLLDAHGIGERPLIFIVHSLGGLLVKQMLRHASEFNQPSWQAIRRVTRGIAFLATPNSGSRVANWVNFWSLIRPSAAVKDLEHNDSRLRELNLWFRSNVHILGCRVLVFYETMPLGSVIVVDEASSDPGIQNVIPIPLDENHATICKPKSTSALQYLHVKRFINDLLPADTPMGTLEAPPSLMDTDPTKATFLLDVGAWKPNEINALAWSPCSRYLAAASDDGTVRVWRHAPNDLLLTITAHRGSVKSVCWAPDGQAIASCSTDGASRIWKFPEGTRSAEWKGDDDWARSIAWSSDGSVIACGYANGVVRGFDTHSGNALFRLAMHEGRVRAVSISASARLLASGATDGVVKISHLRTGATLAAVPVTKLFHAEDAAMAQVICLAWSPSEEHISLGTISGHLVVISTLTWRVVRATKLCRDSLLSLAWSPDSRELVCGSADRTVTRVAVAEIAHSGAMGKLRNLIGARPTRTNVIKKHLGSVRAIAWAPNGGAIASGSTDQTIWIDTGSGGVELNAHSLQMRCAALSPDSQFLAVGSIGRQVMLFGIAPVVHHWSFEGTSEVIVSTATGKGSRLIEKRREGMDEYIRCISWSPDGKHLAIGGDDRTVRVLSAKTGRSVGPVISDYHTEPIRCVAWAPVGNRVVSSSGSRVVIWDVFGEKTHERLVHRGIVLAVAWAPSGLKFATIAEDRVLLVWTNLDPVTLLEAPDDISVLSWSPDSKFIVGVGLGSRAMVWDATYGKLVAEISLCGGGRTIAWDDMGNRCALSTSDGVVVIVDTATWVPVAELESLPPTHRSLCLAFSKHSFPEDDEVTPELRLSSTKLS